MKRKVSLLLALVLCFSCLAVTASAASPRFTDVPVTAWYYGNVYSAVDMGLVNGKTETTFAPNDNLTYAEAVKLAACMHQRYMNGAVTLKNGSPWYSTYVDYCKLNGIISKDYSWDSAASRGGYMEIFAKSLPDTALAAINSVEDGSIPDVAMTHPNAAGIYKLYRAGVVTGVDSTHSCSPASNIKRSEVATILARMMDSTGRISFALGKTETLKVTAQPANHTMKSSSENVDFSVAVSGGTAPYTYTWYYGFNNAYTALTPTTSFAASNKTTRNFSDYDFDDSYNAPYSFYCVIRDNEGQSVVSSKANVYPMALAISKQPEAVTVAEGAWASFSVSPYGGTAPYKYQWYYTSEDVSDTALSNSANLSGATSNTLKFLTEWYDDGALLRCEITDATGSKVMSSYAKLTLKNEPLKAVADETHVVAKQGTYRDISVTVSGGTGSYTYQWEASQYDGASASWSEMTSQTKRTLTLVPSEDYYFRCKVSDGKTTVYSDVIFFDVYLG